MIVKFRKIVIRIFPVIVLLLLAALLLSRVFRPSPQTQPVISITAEEAIEHVGITAEVCGNAVSANYARNIGGQPTFINFENEHPNQVFTVIIWGELRHKWRSPPEQLYANRYICARGRIDLHNNTPQIVISDPGSVSGSSIFDDAVRE